MNRIPVPHPRTNTAVRSIHPFPSCDALLRLRRPQDLRIARFYRPPITIAQTVFSCTTDGKKPTSLSRNHLHRMQVNTPLALTRYYPSSKTPLSLLLPGRKSPHSPVITERFHYAATPSISRQSSHLTRPIFHIPQELLKNRLHQDTTVVHSICSIPTVTNLSQAKCCLTTRNLTPIRHTRCITLIAVNSYLLDLTECTPLQSTIAYTSKHHVHTRAPGIVSWQQDPFNSAWKNGSWPAFPIQYVKIDTNAPIVFLRRPLSSLRPTDVHVTTQ